MTRKPCLMWCWLFKLGLTMNAWTCLRERRRGFLRRMRDARVDGYGMIWLGGNQIHKTSPHGVALLRRPHIRRAEMIEAERVWRHA